MSFYKRVFHNIKRLFVKQTCTYCTLACEPQYGKRCEICEE